MWNEIVTLAIKEKQGIQMPVYDFAVSVKTQYVPEQSESDRAKYVFSYTVTIKNTVFLIVTV